MGPTAAIDIHLNCDRCWQPLLPESAISLYQLAGKQSGHFVPSARNGQLVIRAQNIVATSLDSETMSLTVRIGTIGLLLLLCVSVTFADSQDETDSSIYDRPYKVSLFRPENGEDRQRLWSQTKSIFTYTIVAVGLNALLLDDKEDRDLLDQWKTNVSYGAVWDRDKWVYNYVGHIYAGGLYYQIARKSGYRQWDAFIYSSMMSTFYWEYGVEAFAEKPSIQDLVVTPVMGWIYGEWAFNKERQIRSQGGVLAGSRFLGGTALFLLDPVDSMGSWINKLSGRQIVTAGPGSFVYREVAVSNQPDAPRERQLSLNVQYAFGKDGKPARSRPYHEVSDDPVHTGIVGISLGIGHISLDENWNLEPGIMPEWTLGLYFSPALSVRLKYGRASLEEKLSGERVKYENYSLGGQFYFNTNAKTRPYISAGVGEEIFAEDLERKTFLWHLAPGLHQKISNNWSLQADWAIFYSPSKKTYENSVNARVLYRFGRGEDS
ncbi:MAG: DUF3943 domain-containing protein [Eudoraea sp.]|uniref:DUF3943 domain-containing protein n=1 Tax=Eudoraea sp. TaxID=1979955 RepID=UPI003C72F40A